MAGLAPRLSPHASRRAPSSDVPSYARSLLLALVAIGIGAPSLHAQAVAAPRAAVGTDLKVLTIDDYALWRSIGSVSISPDGRWATYAYTQREVDDSLFVRELDGDGLHLIEGGGGPDFSADSRWVSYSVEAEEDGDGVELLNLETGETRRWDAVAGSEFAEVGQAFIVEKRSTDSDAEHDGVDLVVRYLDAGYEELFSYVDEWETDPDGGLLAYTIDGPDDEQNGIHLVDLGSRTRRVLDAERGMSYSRLTWGEEDEPSSGSLAVLKGAEVEGQVELENAVLMWPSVADGEAAQTIDPRSEEDDDGEMQDGGSPSPEMANGFPEGWVLSERGAMNWAPDASRLFIAIKEQTDAADTLCRAEEGGDDDEEDSSDRRSSYFDERLGYRVAPDGTPIGPSEIFEGDCASTASDVNVFHTADDRIQTVQASRANQDRNKTYLGVAHLGDSGPRFVQLSDESLEVSSITDDGRFAMGRDARPYVSDWKPAYGDYALIDVETGESTPVMEKQLRTFGFSPDGAHYLYWKDGHIWSYEVGEARHANLTENAPVSFINTEDDHFGEAPAYGVEGWTDDGEAVVLRHRYDLYVQPLDGGAPTNLTRGVGDEREIRFRIIDLDPEEDDIDLDGPLVMSAYGQWTKQAGFYRLEGGKLEALVMADARFGNPIKARDADRVLFTRQTFETYPDYHVSATDFSAPVKLTDANPQQSEYSWGRRILFDYETYDGVRLQGTLAIPYGHVDGERRPMLVNFYEKNSQNLHSYPTPRYASSPNFAGYVSAGYLVMQPDVHFRGGRSHTDMLEAVEQAVQTVIDMGYADPDRVGLHGHSYSGGGSSYIAGRSDMFAAITSGAAPINLAGEFNILFTGSGQNNHRYDIYGQGRYGTDPFTDPDVYREQSPITWAPTMDTPLLYLHGEADPTVEYLQGMEWYNALRFLEKPVIFLSYPDAGHGLRRYENQRDFQVRMRQFFDHHLRDVPAPRWMTEGRSYLRMEREVAAVEGRSGGGGGGG